MDAETAYVTKISLHQMKKPSGSSLEILWTFTGSIDESYKIVPGINTKFDVAPPQSRLRVQKRSELKLFPHGAQQAPSLTASFTKL